MSVNGWTWVAEFWFAARCYELAWNSLLVGIAMIMSANSIYQRYTRIVPTLHLFPFQHKWKKAEYNRVVISVTRAKTIRISILCGHGRIWSKLMQVRKDRINVALPILCCEIQEQSIVTKKLAWINQLMSCIYEWGSVCVCALIRPYCFNWQAYCKRCYCIITQCIFQQLHIAHMQTFENTWINLYAHITHATTAGKL